MYGAGRHRCQDCHNEYQREWLKTPKGQAAARRSRDANAAKRRDYAYQYLAEHPCVDCGEADPVVLEFDHVRGVKKRSVMELTGGGSMKALLAEIEKCDVVCANCHTRRTYHLDENGHRIRTDRAIEAA